MPDASYDVYISHASEDTETLAVPIYEQLTARGLSVFLDRKGIRPGVHVPQTMIEAMETSRIALIVLSPEFIAKEWTMKELFCFHRRCRDAVALEEGAVAPLVIPVFYRLSVEDCIGEVVFGRLRENGKDPLRKFKLLDRILNGDADMREIAECIRAISERGGVVNTEDATNEKTPDMQRKRRRLVDHVSDGVVEAACDMEGFVPKPSIYHNDSLSASARESTEHLAMGNLIPYLEAAIGIAKSAYYDDRTEGFMLQKVKEISDVVHNLREVMGEVRNRIKREEHPEVARFRRTREPARRYLNREWDEDVLDFATELLAVLQYGDVIGIRLHMNSVLEDPNAPFGIRERSFAVVLLAARTVKKNCENLCDFFENLFAFNDLKLISKQKRPVILLNLVRGKKRNYEQFDRIKGRIIIRLAMLNTLSLNCGNYPLYHGTLKTESATISKKDGYIVKYVRDRDFSYPYVRAVARTVAVGKHLNSVHAALKDCLESGVQTTKVVILSQSEWRTGGDMNNVRHFSDNIRTFTDHNEVKYLEFRVQRMNDWDNVNITRSLVHGMTAAILVFRFESLAGLHCLMMKSNYITHCFERLRADPHRALYVDTRKAIEYDEARERIQVVAREEGFKEPCIYEDIFFEADCRDAVAKSVSARARKHGTILNNCFTGDSRTALLTIARLLNREVSEREARKESKDIIDALLKLKALPHAIFLTNVRYFASNEKHPRMITVTRGDATGFGLMNARRSWHLTESEYKDFHDITERKPENVRVTTTLEGLSAEAYDSLSLKSGWSSVGALRSAITERRRLFLAVAEERKTLVEKRGQETVVTGVKIVVHGGGMQQFCHAKMIRNGIEVIQLDLRNNDQLAMRALLRLVPTLGKATKTESVL